MIGILENKYNLRVTLIISSLLFGLVHMNLVQSIYAFLLGRIYQKEHNLLPSIIVHLTINISSILYKYSGSILCIVLYLGVLISCFFLFKYKNLLQDILIYEKSVKYLQYPLTIYNFCDSQKIFCGLKIYKIFLEDILTKSEICDRDYTLNAISFIKVL